MRQQHAIPLLIALGLAAAGLAGCTGTRASSANIAVLEDTRPFTLTQTQLDVIRRDVGPSIRNAVAEGGELDVPTAEYSQLQAVSSAGKVYVCGYAKAENIQIEVVRKLAFAGELMGESLFVREFIGGNEGQNDFVRDVCAKRGMDLS